MCRQDRYKSQVNSDKSKNVNEVFLKAYLASKFLQSDIKFSNRWTRWHFVYGPTSAQSPQLLSRSPRCGLAAMMESILFATIHLHFLLFK